LCTPATICRPNEPKITAEAANLAALPAVFVSRASAALVRCIHSKAAGRTTTETVVTTLATEQRVIAITVVKKRRGVKLSESEL